MSEPLGDLAFIFFRTLYEACHGHCVIAGSAALAYYLLPQVLFENNDIDIFVPALPQTIDVYTKTGVRLHPKTLGKGRLVENIIVDAVKHIKENNFISTEWIGGKQFRQVPYFLNAIINIQSIATLRLKRGPDISKTIQIIVLHGYPSINRPTFSTNVWGEYVISTFDLDIVQVFLTPTVYATRFRPLHVYLTNQSAGSIHRKSANMTILPCQHHSQVIKRLDKYMNRNFNIRSIKFHQDTPDIWINYLIRHIAKHNPALMSAIDVVRIPVVLHATVPTRHPRLNLRRLLQKPHDEKKLLYEAYIELLQRRVNATARQSLDYAWC
jgi:hypothetical protein